MSYPQTAVLSCPSCSFTSSYLVSSSSPQRCPHCSCDVSSSDVSLRTPVPTAAARPASPLPTSSSPPLSPSAIERQLEARLHSLTTSKTPVAVYLPTPTHAELQRRLHRLLSSPTSSSSVAADDGQLELRLAQLSGGAEGKEVTDAELERRMRRLQGEDDSVQAAAAGREERKDDGAASTSASGTAGDGDEVERLLKSMQEDVQLDMEQVQRISTLLSKPLMSASSSSSRSARDRGQDAALDDPRRLMAHLQSLPSTELAKLRQQRGNRRRRGSAMARLAADSEGESDSTEEEEQEEADDASDVDAIVMQAMEEAKQA
jgi:hypothetical protein